MPQNPLDTKTNTFGDIISNGKIYKVPDFQRDYSWKFENWEELWLDIKLIQDIDDNHYMGSIVLQDTGNKTFTIIDGQQRLATLSILILASIKILTEFIDNGIDTEANRERKEILIRKFLGDKDPTSLNYASKLHLNENNNDFYQTNLLQIRLPLNKAKLNDSNRLMYDAFNYFYEQVKTDETISKSGELLSRFLDKTIADKLLFIQITVIDELSAYTVFETLNARGIELTSSDLLKNYLFSLVKSDTDRAILKGNWKKISDTIGIREFPQFLRHYLNSKYKLVRQERLFKEIKTRITKGDEVFKLLEDLSNSSDIYSALSESEDDFWKDSIEQQNLISELKLFNVVQQRPLLLAACFKLPTEEFTKVLRIVRTISFRYNIICGLYTNEQEKYYNATAIKLSNGEIVNARGVFTELKPIYVSDEAFKNSFSTKTFNTTGSKARKIVRYILLSIENQLFNKSYSPLTTIDTIEHILPENPSSDWIDEYDSEKHERNVYRLGNLTMLEGKKNAIRASDKGFEHKKGVYCCSQYDLTKDICKFEKWTEEDIKDRQRRLANTALAIWKAS